MHIDPILASGPFLTGEVVGILFLICIVNPAIGLAHLIYSIRMFMKGRTVYGSLSLVAAGLFLIPFGILTTSDGYAGVKASVVVASICGIGWLFCLLSKRTKKDDA